ncbi:MAG: hypothetical protein NVS2B12_06610 [Ktedonobacteraceae bacterium]
MAKTREFQALLQACSHEGCIICRLAHQSVQRYLDNWKYELFTDVELRMELRRTQGFCHTHTWQLADIGATIQLAQAYREVLSDELERLQQGGAQPTTPPAGGLLQRLFEGRHGDGEGAFCPACRQKAQAEERYAQGLRQALLDQEFYGRFTTTTGLCLNHFRLLSAIKTPDAATDGEWPTLLRKAQIACLQRMDEQLGELIRKHDYRFKDEQRGEEMISWKRAAGMVAGEEKRG